MAMTNLPGGLTLAGAGLEVAGATSALGALVFTPAAVTATANGTGTGVIPEAAGFAVVTSAGANNIVTLPAPVVGKLLFLAVGANGCEVRTSAPATIAINGGTPIADAESAIPANTFVMLFCKSAVEWVGWDLTGTTFAAVQASAA